MKNLKLFIFTIVAAISLVAIRSIQIIFLTEQATGFYYEGMESTAGILTAFAGVIVVITAAFGLLARTEEIKLQPNFSLPLGVSALFTGIANIIEPFFYQSFAGDSVPATLITVRSISICLAGLVFCYFGYNFIVGKQPKFEFSALLVISLVIRLMSTFVSFSGMSNISENVIDVVMLLVVLMFFHIHSKALCGIETKRSTVFTFMLGAVSVLFISLSAIPGIIVSLASSIEVVHTPADSPVSFIFTALYIIVYLINISKNERFLDKR